MVRNEGEGGRYRLEDHVSLIFRPLFGAEESMIDVLQEVVGVDVVLINGEIFDDGEECCAWAEPVGGILGYRIADCAP